METSSATSLLPLYDDSSLCIHDSSWPAKRYLQLNGSLLVQFNRSNTGALQDLIEDPLFNSTSASAAQSKEVAVSLSFSDVSSRRSQSINFGANACFVPSHTLKAQRVTMWGRFHQLRTSSSFHSEWQAFIQSSVNVNAIILPTCDPRNVYSLDKKLLQNWKKYYH